MPTKTSTQSTTTMAMNTTRMTTTISIRHASVVFTARTAALGTMTRFM